VSDAGQQRRMPLLTLAVVSSWPMALIGTVAYTTLRYAGDPLYPGADATSYFVSIVLPGLVLTALLVVVRIIVSAIHRQVVGGFVVVTVLLGAVITQVLVQPSGSVLAEQRATAPLIAIVNESVFMAAIWLLLALSYTAVVTYRTQSRTLRQREDHLEEELVHLEEQSVVEEDRTLASISRIIDSVSADISSRESAEVSAALREWSDRVIRPMSHEIASANAVTSTASDIRFSSQWVDAAESVTRRNPLPVKTLAVISFVSAPGVLFRSYPPGIALTALIAITLFTMGAAYSLNAGTRSILPRLSIVGRSVLLYVLMMPMVVGVLVLFRAPELLGYGQEQTTQALSALWLGIVISPLLGLLTIWIRVLLVASSDTLELRESRARELAIEVADRNLRMRQRRSAWAQALHGPVQSAMISAALRLDRAHHAGTLDDASVSRACEPVWQALQSATHAVNEPPPWSEGIGRLHALWDGLVQLHVDVTDDALSRLDHLGSCRAATIEVLTEALSNAVRHGGAHEVTVDISIGDAHTLLVRIRDDGRPVDDAGPSGLGQALFDEVSVQWGRARADDMNELTIELPALEGIGQVSATHSA
jgi:hypothetical protein